jgi:hypothetical protein
MNFGNKKENPVELNGRVQEEKEYKETIDGEIVSDKQYNYEQSQQNANKKRGWFNKNKDKKEFPKASVDSETTWREINLFWPETIAIVGAFVGGIILMFIVRFMSATGLESIKDMLTEQAYGEVAGLINNMNTLFLGIAAIPFLVLIGFYAYRFFVFTPRGNRYPFLRVKRSGAIKFTVDSIKNNEVQFDNGPLGDKMKVVNPRKHWFENNGKPCIVLIEGDDSNADLNKLAGNVSAKAKDTTTVNDMAFQDGRRFERMNAEAKGAFLTPTNILLILILAGVGLALFFLLKNPETTAQLMSGPVAMIGGF